MPIPPYKVYNIGNNSPENLLDFVQILQEELVATGVLPTDYDFEAHKQLVPMQAGDVPVTYADTSALEEDFGFKPSTSLDLEFNSFTVKDTSFSKNDDKKIVLTAVLIAVSSIVIYLKILPNKYLIPLCILLVAICGAGIFFVFRKKTTNKLKIILSAISVVFIGIFTFIGLKLIKTLDFLGDMTTETVNAKTYSVVVLKDSKYTKLEDLQYLGAVHIEDGHPHFQFFIWSKNPKINYFVKDFIEYDKYYIA